jgi:Protein of unknown function (DUF2924)
VAFAKHPAAQPASAPAESVEVELARIGGMTIAQLRACWRENFASDPPATFSKDLLARAICYRLQEQAFGGLSASRTRLLQALAKPGAEPLRHIKVGSVLIREHQGIVHEVLVVLGGFCWRGMTYASLSMIAKTITGTGWNGPRFFGLRSRKADELKDSGVADRASVVRDRKQPASSREASGRSGRRSSVGATLSKSSGWGP